MNICIMYLSLKRQRTAFT